MIKTIQAISDPTRFAIIKLVRQREMSAGSIARRFKGISRPAVSQHLTVLKKNGLIVERREGTSRIYRLRPEGFDALKTFLEGFWDRRLEKLKTVAEKNQKHRGKP